MRSWLRTCLGLALVLVGVGTASPARAWQSLAVQADNVVVELGRDGTALVTHDLLIRTRGGPLKEVVIKGVDADAAPSGNATIVRAKSGREAGVPVALDATGDSESLHLGITYEKGLPSGSYLVRFSYKTDLQSRDRVNRDGPWAVVHWTGPEFGDGVDLLQTTFVVPRAERAPRLLGATDAEPVGMVARDDGVFLSEIHRGSDLDRLALSRPHAAKGERVEWKIEVDAALFGALQPVVPSAVEQNLAPEPASPPPPAQTPWRRLAWIGLAALILPTLLFAKQRAGATRFVLPLGILSRLRYLSIACAMGASLWLALELGQATWAGALLVFCMLSSLQKPVVEPVPARGPGQWQTVEFSAIEFVRPRRPTVAWLDASCWQGLGVFAIATAAFLIVGLRLLGSSPYHSAMTLVYSAVLVPLFFSLGALDNKSAPEEQRDVLLRLLKRLEKWRAVTFEQIGRFASGSPTPDELRLRVKLAGARTGLLSMELAIGFANTSLKRVAVPAVILRVREGSPAHKALPRDAEWSRGRDVDERIAVVRAPLPLLSSLREVLQDLCRALRAKPRHEQARGSEPKAARKPESRRAGPGSEKRRKPFAVPGVGPASV